MKVAGDKIVIPTRDKSGESNVKSEQINESFE